MTQLARILYHLLLIIPVTLTFSCSKDGKNNAITREHADSLISSYVSTLKSSDIEAIKKYWSDKSLAREGFDVMHLCIGGIIHIKEWQRFLDSTQYTYRIKELLEEDDYIIINGEWNKPNDNSNSNETHPMPFYLVRGNNSWLLINPIDVLTKDWHCYETDNMMFFYPPGIDINDHLHEIKWLDEKYRSMCRAMEISIDDKVEYYKASSPQQCGRLLTHPPFNGLAPVTYGDSIAWFQIAVSTTFCNPHEVMHVISASAGISFRFPVFNEGLAVAYGGTSFHTAEYAHNYSKNILDDADYIPIKRLLTMPGSDFIRSNYITYQESGSFVRYLLDLHGMDKLREFISNFDPDGDLDAQSMKVYNLSIDDLEEKWKEYIRDIEVPEAYFSIPDKAELVFSMTDPENDDKGDGDYKYPSNAGYLKGCFDLTEFEVFKGKDNVYFRIGLQKVIEPVSNGPGGAEFIPTAVIAINKGKKGDRQLYKYTNEVELADGYDLKINVGFGVNISNSFGKIFVSTRDFYSEMADLKSNNLNFSLPIEIIGEPEDGWGYFIGIGLTNKPTFNFSGLTPVFKNIPALISGGNYDYLNPAFIDILLNENIDQAEILSDYDSKGGRPASVRLVSKIDQVH
jgi:hypothetical protein